MTKEVSEQFEQLLWRCKDSNEESHHRELENFLMEHKINPLQAACVNFKKPETSKIAVKLMVKIEVSHHYKKLKHPPKSFGSN